MFKVLTKEQLNLFLEQHCHKFHSCDGRVIKNSIVRELLLPMTANTAVYTHNVLHDYMSLMLVPDSFLQQIVEYNIKIKSLRYEINENESNRKSILEDIMH